MNISAALFFLFASFCSGFQLLAQENQITIKKGESIEVIAPSETSKRIFGKMFDANFSELVGRDEIDGDVDSYDVDEYKVKYQQINNMLEFNAFAKFYGILGVNFNAKSNDRYAVLQVTSISRVENFIPDDLPSGYYFYPSKIAYGWSVNYIIWGNSKSFTSDISADISSLISGANINLKGIISKSNLSYKLELRGLRQRSDSDIIVLDPKEIKNNFIPGKPQPIFVEYRASNDQLTNAIQWETNKIGEGEYSIEWIEFGINPTDNLGNSWDTFGGINPIVYFKNAAYIGESDNFSRQIVKIGKNIDINNNTSLYFNIYDKDDYSQSDLIGKAYAKFADLAKYHPEELVELKFDGQLISPKLKLRKIKK